LAGSDTAKQRARVILETIAGTRRLKEACELLGISEQRFHQLREEMMAAAVKALEPGQPGRRPQTLTPAEEQVVALEQQLAEQEIELRTAKARAEIAMIMPEVKHEPAQPDEPEKKTPATSTPKRRRRGRKKRT
jgi:hypothetical protein